MTHRDDRAKKFLLIVVRVGICNPSRCLGDSGLLSVRATQEAEAIGVAYLPHIFQNLFDAPRIMD
jgi:hypothetical protein